MLSGSVQEQLSVCESLEHLDLGNNLFIGLAPFGVLGLRNLSYFNISDNGLRERFQRLKIIVRDWKFWMFSGVNWTGRSH